MGVDFTAITFVGAQVPDEHFFALGEENRRCYRHGAQSKPYCGDCGIKTKVEHVKLWTPAMLKAAELWKCSPEKLWNKHAPEDGLYKMGVFGRWRFGYDREHVLWGTVISRTGSYDKLGSPGTRAFLPDVNDIFTMVAAAFSKYDITDTVRVFAVLDCG